MIIICLIYLGDHVVARIDDGESRDSTTDSDGFVSFNFGKLNAGNYSVELVYPGNEIYDSVTKLISVNVVSSVPAWGSNSGDSSVFGDGESVGLCDESVGLECTGFILYVFVLLFSFLFVCFKI